MSRQEQTIRSAHNYPVFCERCLVASPCPVIKMLDDSQELASAFMELRRAAVDFWINSPSQMQKSVLGKKLQEALNV